MKKCLFIIIFLTLILSCDENETSATIDTTELLGTWKITEVLADPGDGSGEFMPTDGDKQLTFRLDGSVTTNGNFCSAPVINGQGTYTLSDSTITSICDLNVEIRLPFEWENEELILYYLCIEGCAEKYRKINN